MSKSQEIWAFKNLHKIWFLHFEPKLEKFLLNRFENFKACSINPLNPFNNKAAKTFIIFNSHILQFSFNLIVVEKAKKFREFRVNERSTQSNDNL